MKPNDRDDLSRFLVHLTRDGNDGDAEANLLDILRSGRIEARNAHCLFQHMLHDFTPKLRGRFRTVCLTEVPFTQLRHLAEEIPGRSIRLKPYGLVFRKSALLKRGASPAIYINAKGTVLRDYLLTEFKRHFGTNKRYDQLKQKFPNEADAIIHYYSLVNVISDKYDFTWEREWRFPGNLAFGMSEVFAVIAPQPKAFRSECRRKLPLLLWEDVRRVPVVSPEWNAERIIDELSVELWDAVS